MNMKSSKYIQLNSLFLHQDSERALRNSLNDLLKEKPEYTSMILGIVLYPALKWSLYGETVVDLIKMANTTEWGTELNETKQLLKSVFGFGDDLILDKRAEYFILARELVQIVEDSIAYIANCPFHGHRLVKVCQIATNQITDSKASNYEVKKYAPLIAQILYEKFGDDFDGLIEQIIEKNSTPAETKANDELLYAYHNMQLLLKEYARLMWTHEESKDYITRILHCKTANEVYRTTSKMSTIYSADIVLRFLLLITGSIALLQYWPGGKENARILKMLVSNRNVTLENGDCIYIKDEDMAKGLGLSTSAFSRKKKEACELLGLILWGYDDQNLSELITFYGN